MASGEWLVGVAGKIINQNKIKCLIYHTKTLMFTKCH